jgi:ankyrin repeat protein
VWQFAWRIHKNASVQYVRPLDLKRIRLMQLHEIEEWDIEAVKQAIAAGADVNAKCWETGRSPLTLAVADGGHKEIAELLITEGADVNGKDDSYREGTPLHMATIQDRKEVAELLIAKGSDVNAMDNDGQTPLDYAGDETADLLRKHGGKTGEELKAEGK